MSLFRTQNAMLLAKIESPIGTDAAPVVGSDAMRVQPPKPGFNFETEQTNFARGTISASQPIVDGGVATLQANTFLMSSSTPGTTPPDICTLLRGCAMSQTLLAADLTNTAQAGAAGSITLAASGSSSTDNAYRGRVIEITDGTGAGQRAVISGYVGSTKIASVYPNWGTPPDNTSVYAIRAGSAMAPITQGQEALTLYAYLRNSTSGGQAKLRKIIAAMGGFNIGINTRKIATLAFNFQGQLPALPSDVSDPGNPTLTGNDPLPFINAKAILGGNAVKFNAFTLDSGNKPSNLDDPSQVYGYDTTEVTGRTFTGKITPALTLNSTRNAVSDFVNSVSKPLWLCWGAVGSGVSLYLPGIRYTGYAPDAIGDFEAEGLPFQAVGDDLEALLTFF